MLSNLRLFAQTVRHAPGLSSLTPLWGLLRQPYLKLLTSLAGKNGLPVTVGSHSLRLHPIFATRNWEAVEAESYRAFAASLNPGDVVYDIGAHIGTYTLIALQKIGSQGRVIAYEPHEFTRTYFMQHLQWNGGSEQTICRTLCCGAKPGTTDFYCLPEQAEGMNGLVPVEGFNKVTVQVNTLDAEVAELGLIPSLIKIDVEGAEWDVLKGAEQTLRQYQPRLCLSLHPIALAKLGVTPETVLEWLTQRGYSYEVIARDHEIHVMAKVS
ncbi:FkbM family methyltransferase [Microcoleus sp. FACHB-53]|nr:FkbM family methyltransferase [Microcoleus sp. FACHB-53]